MVVKVRTARSNDVRIIVSSCLPKVIPAQYLYPISANACPQFPPTNSNLYTHLFYPEENSTIHKFRIGYEMYCEVVVKAGRYKEFYGQICSYRSSVSLVLVFNTRAKMQNMYSCLRVVGKFYSRSTLRNSCCL